MAEQSNEKIIKLLQEKVLLKQDVIENTKVVFNTFKEILSKISAELKSSTGKISKDVITNYKDTGENEAEFTLADETLLFVIHTNIFTFDKTHEVWKTKYVQQDSKRAFCGKIFIYNFLSDSFLYNRINDVGYLIARIFINKERHYFVEGKKQFENLFNDFENIKLDTENIRKIIETALLYSLDFDPFTPPFDSVPEISVKEVLESGIQSRIATGKRLGFQFERERKDREV